MSKQTRKWITRLTAFLLIFVAFNAFAASCPTDTVYIGEDEDYLYCRRRGDYIGNDQAVRAAILRNAMTKLRYPYHEVERRCLAGNVSMCPLNEEDHSRGCYDCSALVFDVLRSVGVWVEPNANNQYNYFKSIPQGLKTENPMYGDIVFIQADDEPRIGHTGIYVGTRDNRIYYLNASVSKQKVWVSRMPQGKRPFAYGNVSVLRIGKSD
ncbi:MAG: NlpC/P60 family protein [Nitrospirota bacterium]